MSKAADWRVLLLLCALACGGGRQGFEIVAPGQKDGAVIDVYAFMVRGNDSAFAGFGHVGKKQSAETVKRLSKLVRSVELDDSILGPVTR
jgi:hypothetical protein